MRKKKQYTYERISRHYSVCKMCFCFLLMLKMDGGKPAHSNKCLVHSQHMTNINELRLGCGKCPPTALESILPTHILHQHN